MGPYTIRGINTILLYAAVKRRVSRNVVVKRTLYRTGFRARNREVNNIYRR